MLISAHERLLLALVLFELGVFSLFGSNFFTASNAFEILRLSVELGLLALALTPVIITGGIDLSVGSMMGLAAVIFGALWRDYGWSIAAAAAGALLAGFLGGALNAALIARLSLPPLIVTLGTYSLFRGLAEGLTRGLVTYSGFPPAFLAFGQGWQVTVFVAATAAVAILLHTTAIGRGLYAIGSSPEGARWGAIPVGRRLALVYILSGFVSAAAALVYVAHIGQAKSDAGTGYELMAITAVVLGGTSIFGGRGSIGGTVLGLAAIVVLQNGLRLAALPAELSGILTGVLLLSAIATQRLARPQSPQLTQEFHMKNSQIAALCAAVLAAGCIVAGSNWALVRSLRTGPLVQPSSARITIAMMPKAKGDPYFASCKTGAEEAAKELNVDLLWDGPTDLDPAKQNELVEGWITRGVSAIAVSVANREAISTVLRKARAHKIPVFTWDADAEPDARDFFINQATPEGIGNTLVDETARLLGGRGEFAIVTGALSAANQNEWIKYMRARLAAKYPGVKLAVVRPSDDDRDRAFSETQQILKVYPNVRVICGISAPAVPGAAEAVKQSGRMDVHVTGLSLPRLCQPYVHGGSIDSVVLWNTRDLGYLTVWAANALIKGSLKAGATSIAAGRLGNLAIRGSEIILGQPFIFTKSNIDRFDF